MISDGVETLRAVAHRSAWILVPVVVVGSAASLLAGVLVGREGLAFGLGVTLAVPLFVAAVAGFIFVPHVVIAAAIPYFALLPMLKLFVSPLLGGTKDAVTLAAVVAASFLLVRLRVTRQEVALDSGVVLGVALLFALYTVNIGGALSSASGYGWEWFHGARLVAEPLALLLAGMVLPQPRRTLRWATVSLVATGVLVAAFGIVQQALGVERLVSLGYRYGQEVRQIGPHLRSFGTLDDPFAYAGFLLLCAVVVLFGWRWRLRTYGLIALVGGGLVVSYARSAALGALTLLVLALVRRGRGGIAIVLALLATVSAAVILATAVGAPTTAVLGSPARYLPLEARAELWEQAVGHSPTGWTFGRGVGSAGTASQRASEPLIPVHRAPATSGTVVDSSYVVTVSDVGVIGLLILLALFGRLLVLAFRAAASGEASGWIAVGLLTIMLLDALTRESLTSFPIAYLGMLMVGVAAATWPKGLIEPVPRGAALTQG